MLAKLPRGKTQVLVIGVDGRIIRFVEYRALQGTLLYETKILHSSDSSYFYTKSCQHKVDKLLTMFRQTLKVH